MTQPGKHQQITGHQTQEDILQTHHCDNLKLKLSWCFKHSAVLNKAAKNIIIHHVFRETDEHGVATVSVDAV